MKRVRVLPETPSWTGGRTRTHPVPSRTALLSHACASVRIACAMVFAVLERIFLRFEVECAHSFGEIAHAKSPPGWG
ncbi:hypothetical protein TthHB5018_11000 [Thermus thermophilus]|uniref:Uncharacterized protein n=1 Tax=Thermus thermophilus TaxID=274 RepID=A0A7R7TDK6_THETH|nr:hypothetical protein TthHB5018_11000 [Thermus thermophilus]